MIKPTFVILLCCLQLATSGTIKFPRWGRPPKGFMNRYHSDGEPLILADDNLVRDNYTQLVDHFDSKNNATYLQRYWYNGRFTQNKNIVFLMIQGEGIATDKWISNENYTYMKLAAQHGADVFQLEHRCFGYSRPYPDLTFKSLQVCTVEQALEDTAAFIKFINVKYNFTNPKWITFGGSYPGALSALFRMNYPQLTAGAVASSAPMDWTLDFYQYAQVVETSITTTDANCAAAVNTAFSKMQQMSISLEGRAQLNTYFSLDPPFDNATSKLDITNFFANVFSIYQDVTQYSRDGRNDATMNGLDLNHLCQIMNNNTADEVQRVRNVLDWYFQMNGSPVTSYPNSYSDLMNDYKNTTYDDWNEFQDNAAARGWMWLCCNQVGVLQTTDQGRNIFQQIIPLNYFVDMCTEMFDPSVNIQYIRDRNLQFNKKYGRADGYKATNVILPNGSIDPWHILGTYVEDPANHQKPLLIDGTAHCADMYPPYAGEPASLQAARDTIAAEVSYYLSDYPDNSTTTPGSPTLSTDGGSTVTSLPDPSKTTGTLATTVTQAVTTSPATTAASTVLSVLLIALSKLL